MNLKGRNFLKLMDYTPEEILYLIDLAADLKSKKKQGILHDSLIGKNIALIFEKTSTRTRCSFEVAAHDLGMHVTYLDPSGSQIGKKESIPDTARVLGRMFDGIEYRGYGQDIVEDEYFGRILYDELAAILKQIKAAHGTDKTTSDGAAIEQARKQLENAQKFEGSPLEKKMNVLMGQIGIDYSKLTKEEQMTLLRVFNKSSMLKHRTKAGMRGKHRR